MVRLERLIFYVEISYEEQDYADENNVGIILT